MPREDMIAFLDLETSGTDEHLDSIIEVGIALFSWPEFKEIDSFRSVVTPTQEGWERMNAKDVVREMHKANGLYEEIETIVHDVDLSNIFHRDNVDLDIANWLKPYGDKHIPLAGSGVGHFDRRFIKAQLPRLDKHLSHYALDVGVNRRQYLMLGLTPAPDTGKTHRALDDARVHATEFDFYMNDLRRLVVKRITFPPIDLTE